ncbi:MAG: YceI family protein, partial [Bacteroidota bacterium]
MAPEKVFVDLVNLTPGTYVLDEAHSYVNFGVRHVLATSKGKFDKVSGTVIVPEGGDVTKTQINIVIDIKSINTGNPDRDAHLQKDDFFYSEKFPTITYVANSIERTETGYVAKGQLTMRGITKNVDLPFSYLGDGKTPMNTDFAAFEGQLKINKA